MPSEFSPRDSLSSLDTSSTTDSVDLLNKHRQHLEEQKKRLERHQKFLSRRRRQKEREDKEKTKGGNSSVDEEPGNGKSHKKHTQREVPSSPAASPTVQQASSYDEYQNLPHEIQLSTKGQHFLQERERKLEEMRRSRDKILESELHHTPQLTERTRKLVERTRRRKSQNNFGSLSASFSSTGSFKKYREPPVEDQLMEKEYARRQSIFLQSEKQYALENPGTPKITPQAARMVREGSVTDRLFEMASKMGEKKRFHALQKRIQEEESLTFEPHMQDSSESVSHSRTMPVYLDLLQRDEQRKMKKLEKIERLMEKEKDLHKPKINPVSQEIASRLPSTSRERLLAPSKQRQSDNPNLDEANCSFRPELCAKSREIEAEKELSSTERIDKLYQRDRRRREKIENLRSFYEQKELEECTFAPKTSGVAEYERPRSRKRGSSRVPFNERAQQWQEKRESKINVKRRNIEAKEMENCTFHPNIVTQDEERGQSLGIPIQHHDSRFTSLSQTHILETSDQPPVQPSGYTEFIKRQQEARRRKEQKTSGVFVTGENWKNRVTVPKEFKLGMSRMQRKHVSTVHTGLPSSPSYVQRAVHKQIEKLSTSFEESPAVDRYNAHDDSAKENQHSSRGNPPRTSGRGNPPPRASRNGRVRHEWEMSPPPPPQVAASQSDEEQFDSEDDMEHIPPQGLFSAGGTLSILQGLNFAYS
mmetsp:Transcript_7303/g.27327  ORF Transcript_7303/g.27327 Transcript_7303/m.27327 type:complete len:704 (-) Transcript_7303:53-2164(-)|eukprot:CAMPEP_0117452030 /NCGR_PEP_ID=MMETSP0759-20121206/9357_1 /TAXON_ID=63605 /ORGANISM="Percolomonas cosmopolitus, Strain WS" /LENGTH=703 /DNA_ID=CAMNT_0005244737 /DNA_START=215 /DNA_END=2326 /DNA_ORIENTATION=-